MDTKLNKTFIFDQIRVFFKHTDHYGGVHPYNFLEWTSYVREAFFSQKCGDFRLVLESPIKMMTAKIQASFFDECFFGDQIEAQFTTARIKRVSFDVKIRFFNPRTDKLVCQTDHTLVFVDSRNQQFTTIPDEIKQAVILYQEVDAKV